MDKARKERIFNTSIGDTLIWLVDKVAELEMKGDKMNLAKLIVNGVSEELIDYFVENIAEEMRAKLSEKRLEGRKEWHPPFIINNHVLLNMLQEHLYKGDMIDAINIAAMIYTRNLIYGESTKLENINND